jgi:hypothetical protein
MSAGRLHDLELTVNRHPWLTDSFSVLQCVVLCGQFAAHVDIQTYISAVMATYSCTCMRAMVNHDVITILRRSSRQSSTFVRSA